MNFLVFFFCGILLSGMEAYLFIRFTKSSIATYSGLFLGISFVGGSWYFLYDMFAFTTMKSESFVVYIGTFLVCLPLFLFLFCKFFINKTKDKYPLRMLDFFLGNVKALENYVNNRQEDIDRDFKINELEEMKNENEKKSSELEKMERKQNCQEKNLQKLKRTLEKSISETTHIELPVDHKHPVTSEFVNKMEAYINCVLKFDHLIADATNQFTEDIENESSDDLLRYLKSYLLCLCLYTSKILFGNNDGVKTHVRYFKDGYYETIACCVGEFPSDASLTRIPAKEGMIWKSNRTKQSLIKSCNSDDHFEASNDHIWKDYITIPVTDLKKDQDPILSIGISVKYPDLHLDMLKFLNFIKIENIFSKNLCQFNKKFDIINIIVGGGVKDGKGQ